MRRNRYICSQRLYAMKRQNIQATVGRGPVVSIIITNDNDGKPDNEKEIIKETQQNGNSSDPREQDEEILPTGYEEEIPFIEEYEEEIEDNDITEKPLDDSPTEEEEVKYKSKLPIDTEPLRADHDELGENHSE